MRYCARMKKAKLGTSLLLFAAHSVAVGRGVSPYLPLKLEPEIEAQIERVLILADKPVMRRPIAAATVLDALPKARKIDPALCQQVERYLSRFMHTEGIARASVEGAATSGSGAATVAPNRYGMRENSKWDVSAQAYTQFGDYVLVNAGVNAYQGKTDFTGSMISLGFRARALATPIRCRWPPENS